MYVLLQKENPGVNLNMHSHIHVLCHQSPIKTIIKHHTQPTNSKTGQIQKLPTKLKKKTDHLHVAVELGFAPGRGIHPSPPTTRKTKKENDQEVVLPPICKCNLLFRRIDSPRRRLSQRPPRKRLLSRHRGASPQHT